MARLRLVLVLSVVIACLALSATPALALSQDFSGKNADAYHDSSEPDGSYTWLMVWGGSTEGRWKESGKPSSFSSDGVSVSYQHCDTNGTFDPSDDVYTAMWADVLGVSLGIDRNLTSAVAKCSTPVTVSTWYGSNPWSGAWREPDAETTAIAELDVTWTGTGPLFRESGHHVSNATGFVSISRDNTKRRNAIASGTFSLSGSPVFSGDFGWAGIYDTRSGYFSNGEYPMP